MHEVFKQWRKKRGLNQMQTAELFSISQALVSMLESGQRKFSPTLQWRLSVIDPDIFKPEGFE